MTGLDSLVMIATSFPRSEGPPPRQRHPAATQREEHSMDSLTSGTFVGAGSFRCARCDYALTLIASDMLTACPGCGGREFVRASLFSTERIPAGATEAQATSDEGTLLQPSA